MKVLDIKSSYGGFNCHVLLEPGDQRDDHAVVEEVGKVCHDTIYQANVNWMNAREAKVELCTP